MCLNEDAHAVLLRMPKIEQHIHLEGALTPELVFKFAERNSVKLPRDDPIYVSPEALQAHYDSDDAFRNLQEFLDVYGIGLRVLVEERDFYELGMSYFRRAAAENVRHAEVFFDPQAHTIRNIPFETILTGFRRACDDAQRELNVSSVLIACFLRHLPPEHALEAYDVVRPHLLNGDIAGIGLDSAEKRFPPEIFKDLYARAIKDNVRRTAHAGEEGGPENIYTALDMLKCERIDHGRIIPKDRELLERVRGEKILVTLCPLSNLKLKGVEKIEDLPVRIFLDKGISFTINSDDPAYFGGWIQANFCAVQDAFNLTFSEWEDMYLTALDWSWATAERKWELKQEWKKIVAEISDDLGTVEWAGESLELAYTGTRKTRKRRREDYDDYDDYDEEEEDELEEFGLPLEGESDEEDEGYKEFLEEFGDLSRDLEAEANASSSDSDSSDLVEDDEEEDDDDDDDDEDDDDEDMEVDKDKDKDKDKANDNDKDNDDNMQK